MNREAALIALAEGIQQIRGMSRSQEDGDPFRRWRVRTSTALAVLLGADTPEVKAFYRIVYWPQQADAQEAEHEQAWEQGKETVLYLLIGATNKAALEAATEVQELYNPFEEAESTHVGQ